MDESILMNYLRGGCNDEECQQVELWCEEAPENRQILEQLYYTLFVGDRMAVMDAVDTEASLTKFKSLVREKGEKSQAKKYIGSMGTLCVRDSRFSGRSCFRRRNCVGIAFQ